MLAAKGYNQCPGSGKAAAAIQHVDYGDEQWTFGECQSCSFAQGRPGIAETVSVRLHQPAEAADPPLKYPLRGQARI